MNPASAASLFLLTRGRGGDNHEEDQHALIALLTEFSIASYEDAIKNAKSVYKEGSEPFEKWCDDKLATVRQVRRSSADVPPDQYVRISGNRWSSEDE